MTIRDLIDELEEYDPDYEVIIAGGTDFYIDVDDENQEVTIELGD